MNQDYRKMMLLMPSVLIGLSAFPNLVAANTIQKQLTTTTSIIVLAPQTTVEEESLRFGEIDCIDGHKNTKGGGHNNNPSPGHNCEIIITPTASGMPKSILFDGTFGSTDTAGINGAVFSIYGPAGQNYSMSLPADKQITLTDSQGVQRQLRLDDFTAFSDTANTIGRTGMFDANGKDSVMVGTTINIPSGFQWSGIQSVDIVFNVSF